MNDITATTTPATWATRVQSDTVSYATENGAPWERDDLMFVAEMTGVETDEDIAYATGRTLYAIWAITHRIRRMGLDAVIACEGVARSNEATRRANAPTYDFVTTFPVGWND